MIVTHAHESRQHNCHDNEIGGDADKILKRKSRQLSSHLLLFSVQICVNKKPNNEKLKNTHMKSYPGTI